MPSVSVLIVNYNSGGHLAECLQGLAVQTFPDFEAVVVDNASIDGSWTLAQSRVAGDPRFLFMSAGCNSGFAAGNNLAADVATGAWLALLNPDAVPASDWLEQLMDATRRHPGATMFGSTQIDGTHPDLLDGAGDHYLAIGLPWRGGHGWPISAVPPEGEVFSPCAAACLIGAAAFREAKGFDERFFCYVEDIDLALRLRLIGHHCIQVPSAVVRHAGGASSGGARSPFARRQGTRNLVWCFVKSMPPALFWPFLPLHLLALVLLMLKSLATGSGRPVCAGVLSGLRGVPAMWRSRRLVQRSRRINTYRIACALSWNPLAYLGRAPRTIRRESIRLTGPVEPAVRQGR